MPTPVLVSHSLLGGVLGVGPNWDPGSSIAAERKSLEFRFTYISDLPGLEPVSIATPIKTGLQHYVSRNGFRSRRKAP